MAEIGRQVKYGIAKESTFGTPVAATSWVNQLSFALNPMSEYVDNVSAYGNIVKTNNSTVLRSWSEGSFEAKLTSDRVGLFLLGAFGTINTTTNADASTLVKDHTATINENINGQSFTFHRKDSLTTKQYPGGRINDFTLSMELGDYIKISGNILAQKGASTTGTPAFTAETEFTPKNFNVKTASSAAGLGAAQNISALESFTLHVNPNLELDWQSGSGDPYSISSRGYDLTFEMTTRYLNTTYEDAFTAGTKLALQVSAVNSSVVIGTSANPGLVFTAPSVHITDWSRSEDLDAPITQSMTGTIHYSPADAYALRAVLTNLTASY